jgi:glycosyltransferase involved in cell wall biosynthesis
MPRVLFIASHRRDRSPSQRYRFEQYFSFLEAKGFSCELSNIITEKDDQYFYSKDHFLRKLWILLKSFFKRYRDVQRYKNYDIVFVQREAIMVGITWFERSIRRKGIKYIFDFDDSIWLMDTSEGNKKYEWLKDPEKTARNIRHANLVLTGNNYLADYARHYNDHVMVIPTTIDTNFHKPLPVKKDKIIIGWSGSLTTIKHFEYAIPFLKIIQQKYPQVEIHVVGDTIYSNPELNVKGIRWTAANEVEIINQFSIGIMPLPADEWAKGKCGLKGLSYMACEVPTVMSPVGVNTEIIQHGENGFLATSVDEWVDCISKLIESAELRARIGKAARQTVIDKYSVSSQQGNYLKAFRDVLQQR